MTHAPAVLHTALVAPEQAGMRLDRWLAASFADLSRSRLKGLIEDGQVSTAAGPARDPASRVRAGQAYSLTVPESVAAEPLPQAIPLVIVHEDDALVVVDKPAGMVVHPAPGSPDTTLVNALLAHCGPTLSGIGGVKRPGIVHRLDKDTSGLMVVAKTEVAHHALAAQFAARSVSRAYQAVVWGVPHPTEGQIEGDIGRSPADRKKMAVVNRGGKVALTRYKVMRVFGGMASLLECRLATGRTHQIRVHLAAKGHPLLGDPVYGRGGGSRVRALLEAGKRAGPMQEVLSFRRQALHAVLLGFVHPTSGERLLFESDIPADLRNLIGTLERI